MAQLIHSMTASSPVTTNIASLSNVTLYTFSVPANTLRGPIGQSLRFRQTGEWQNNSGGARLYTLSGSFGGTVFASDQLISMPAAAGRRTAEIEIDIFWTTNASQNYRMGLSISATLAVTTGSSGDWATTPLLPPTSILNVGTISTAAAQTLLVQVLSDATTATQIFTQRGATLELV